MPFIKSNLYTLQVFVLLNLISFSLSSQVTFQKILGGGGTVDYLREAKQTSDNGIIYTGYTIASGSSSADVILMKTDEYGVIQWSRRYGGLSNEYGWAVIQSSDGGYVMGGRTTTFGAGEWDFYLIKTDGIGNLLWTKTFGGSGADVGYDIVESVEGGYVITGSTDSYGQGFKDVYLIKTDINGNLLWS